MKKPEQSNYAQTSQQIAHIRRLYSRIGEPLPADVIIDLYQHLGKALDAGKEKPRFLRKQPPQA